MLERPWDPCKCCRDVRWCRRHGCLTWNDNSRRNYDRLKERAKQSNNEIDELEKLLGN